MKSFDDLDVWWLYERNSRYYYTCTDLSKCPSVSDDDEFCKECSCQYNQIVSPIEIGEWWQTSKLNVRSYIKIGSDCPICMAPMIHKRNAWITYCGHSFHRTCLVQFYNSYMRRKDIIHYTNCVPCPICRSELPTCCTGIDVQKYNHLMGKHRNELDALEDFNITSDLRFPEDCWKCNKYFGMNSKCKHCKTYRITGNY